MPPKLFHGQHTRSTYSVIGRELKIVQRNHKLDIIQFRIQGNIMTFTKIILVNGSIPSPRIHGFTLTRDKG